MNEKIPDCLILPFDKTDRCNAVNNLLGGIFLLSKFSVKKPFTVFVGVVLVVLLGGISFTQMTTDLLPSLDLPYVLVMTTYPGASPEKIESTVTKPLEQTLATTGGVENISSVSSENSSVVILEFSQGTNMDTAMIELTGKVDLIKGQFDDAVGSPMLMKMNPDMMPIMMASVDINGMDTIELSDEVSSRILSEFEKIEGVASVSATGLVEENLQIVLNQDKINALNEQITASLDEELGKVSQELDSAKQQIADGQAELAAQSAAQTQQLEEAEQMLSLGLLQLSALETQNQFELQTIKTVQTGMIERAQQQIEELKQLAVSQNRPLTSTEESILQQLQQTIDTAQQELAQKTAEAETSLAETSAQRNELEQQQQQLQEGKTALSTGLQQAAIELSLAEKELEQQTAEFENSRDQIYQQAGLDGVITQEMVSGILAAQNFSMPAGYLKEDGQSYLVKVGDAFQSEEEIKNLTLFSIDQADIGTITVADVADVALVNNAGESYTKVNENDGIILSMQKQSTYSTAEVSDRIQNTIDRLMEEDQNLRITPLMDQGIYIDIVINSVLSNLAMGGVLAVIILLFFLKDWKPTLVIACSIPISVMFALVLMYFSGVTMNIISLSGLALGVGMLVDNSIVVIENIYRLRSLGASRITAAVSGAKQVSGAIFASTLTTICVFLPIVFTEGISRQLFTDMGLTIAYSLIASLIVALTLVPAMSSNLLTNTSQKAQPIFTKVVSKYASALRWSLKHRAIVLTSVVLLLVYSVVSVASMGTSFIPSMESSQMSVSLTMPKGSAKNNTIEASNQIIDAMLTIDDIETVGALQSSSMLGGETDPLSASFYVMLKEDKELTNQQIKDQILEKTKEIDGKISVSTSNMDMSSLGSSGISVSVKGADLERLKSISNEVAKILEQTEGTAEVSNGIGDTNLETRITVDKTKAIEHGLTVAQIYQQVAAAVTTQTTATTLNTENYDYPVIVLSDQQAITRENIGELELTPGSQSTSASGMAAVGQMGNLADSSTEEQEEAPLLLKDVAQITQQESLESISHDNQQRYLTVSASIASGYNVGLVSRDFEENLKGYELPEGYTLEFNGENETINSALSDLLTMILLAVVFIYMIMVAQFQSLLSPFIVMFTIPLAFTGGLLALQITGMEISIISMLGFLVLAGIVVNNGIVFVDYTNQLRLEGKEKTEALVETGVTRIRPILMTALTTILGLSTMAFGIGMGSDMVQPMAIVTIGGLIYATLLTLFVVPIMYDILYRKKLKPIQIEEFEEPTAVLSESI